MCGGGGGGGGGGTPSAAQVGRAPPRARGAGETARRRGTSGAGGASRRPARGAVGAAGARSGRGASGDGAAVVAAPSPAVVAEMAATAAATAAAARRRRPAAAAAAATSATAAGAPSSAGESAPPLPRPPCPRCTQPPGGGAPPLPSLGRRRRCPCCRRWSTRARSWMPRRCMRWDAPCCAPPTKATPCTRWAGAGGGGGGGAAAREGRARVRRQRSEAAPFTKLVLGIVQKFGASIRALQPAGAAGRGELLDALQATLERYHVPGKPALTLGQPPARMTVVARGDDESGLRIRHSILHNIVHSMAGSRITPWQVPLIFWLPLKYVVLLMQMV